MAFYLAEAGLASSRSWLLWLIALLLNWVDINTVIIQSSASRKWHVGPCGLVVPKDFPGKTA